MVNSPNRSIQLREELIVITNDCVLVLLQPSYSYLLPFNSKMACRNFFVATSLILHLHEIIQLQSRIMKYITREKPYSSVIAKTF